MEPAGSCVRLGVGVMLRQPFLSCGFGSGDVVLWCVGVLVVR